ncbi:hypothetical protein PIB30_016505 [Stylosanthes scabra]|uniref:Uncharacterized protein n=1 Tax=Stylosanthes scabra TaxID=79078 RepID=A0ABU6Z6D8_9FABA|nr:hypothetical protein [Stylosanthes scabra]
MEASLKLRAAKGDPVLNSSGYKRLTDRLMWYLLRNLKALPSQYVLFSSNSKFDISEGTIAVSVPWKKTRKRKALPMQETLRFKCEWILKIVHIEGNNEK